MKLKHILLVVTVVAGILLSSCGESFLYKAPQGSIDQDALANQTGIDLLTVNAYANFHENGWGASPGNWSLGSVYGGDANKGSDANDQAVFNEIEMYNALPTSSYPAEKYAWVYKGAKRVNVALQTMEMAEDLPEAFEKSRRGELHFLRAVFYFEGIKVFGPFIPWVDDTMTENDPKVYNNVDIYANVLSDIDVAIANLPNTQDAPGRANAWAAKALKAKVLMQRGDMAAAKPILADVVANGVTSNGKPYELEDDLNANFDSFRNNGSESVFGIQFSNENNNANPGMSLNYPHGGAGSPGGCCGFFQPSQELANSYKVDANGLPYLDKSYRNAPYVSVQAPAGDGPLAITNTEIAVDPRLDFAIGRFGIPYKDWGVPQNNWVRDVGNGGVYMPKKHVFTLAELDAGLASGGNGTDGWAPGSSINLQYLSLRDIILLYAECLANDNELPAAMAEVNKIRERAALDVNIIVDEEGEPVANYLVAPYPTSHAAFSNKDACIDAIRFERKLELSMEGQRWFDLTRWGGQYMSQQLKEYIEFEANFLAKFAIASVLSPDKTMFPLPEGQIQTMGVDENGQPYLVQPAPWQ